MKRKEYEMNTKVENVIIERTGDLLRINKEGLISMIDENSDKNSKEIDNKLINMIQCFYGNLSLKQLNWILEKVKYITRHNKEYIQFKGIKDIQFV